ncbi:HEPN domain-containing protein [Siccirubricoccus phaeus]|uniref:HEPN domain-containing protein n=1 Tax=Siccirubricoccus phaeus TaxID=2595053 RepID=UPI0011F2D514|nr:HEPN domain-containing protein [Siccirubricoccus phaeus]
MTAEVAALLAKARNLLTEGEAMQAAALPNAVGRAAYLAVFNAAMAFIYVRSGRVVKTHRGVRAEFARLAREESRLDPGFARFLSAAYEMKVVADYEADPAIFLAMEPAAAALATAHRFVAAIAALLAEETP